MSKNTVDGKRVSKAAGKQDKNIIVACAEVIEKGKLIEKGINEEWDLQAKSQAIVKVDSELLRDENGYLVFKVSGNTVNRNKQESRDNR